MKANKKKMFLLIQLPILSGLIFLLWGCQIPGSPVKVIFPPDSAELQQSSSVEKRFKESASQGPTPIESMIKLSEKYAKLSEETALLRQKSLNLATKNHDTENQLADSKAKLQQAQKELAEANDLLIEMRIELNNWKVDILGFRNEMRDAEKTQLEALLKILEVLGAEVKEELAQSQDARTYAVSPGEPDQPQQ